MQTAKEKQRTKEPVKIWLYELINLAYEMKIYLMSLQVKLFLKLNPVLSSEVRKLKPTCYNRLMMSPRSVKEMTVRLQDIVMDKEESSLDGSAINELPSSIEYLSKLVILNLGNCSRLEGLPNKICKLKSLQYFNLSGCSNLKS
ncbi:hypothetical protein WN944_009578 [Citrus x changshan-huyou]|uniref:Disease resistance protein n=1 Tax=Citrus x changshan-huyou TaxID=2935761 RepID=A0AAP0MQ20_9ROSI